MKMRTTQEMNNEKDALLKEIYAEEKIIASLPPYVICGTESAQKRARHQKNRADLLQRLELISEGEYEFFYGGISCMHELCILHCCHYL